MQHSIEQLNVKLFADGADIDGIRSLARQPYIRGFTTNPTLMRQAGVSDYEAFAREMLSVVQGMPVSFEVFSDDFDEMYDQARYIAEWGSNVFVKIPITNTQGDTAIPLVRALVHEGVQVNVTAILTQRQIEQSIAAVAGGPAAYVSVFAGRVADTGRDPLPMIRSAVALLHDARNAELIWASPREVLNVFQADEAGCHVITVTHELLRKLTNVGRDLQDFSLDTVRMFRRDAVAAGFSLAPRPVVARAAGF
jgi:transaldolase